MPDLTSQMVIFCREYFGGKTATQAAIEARYSFKTARKAGSRLLARVDIRSHLAELQQQADDEAIMDVVERKKILTEIGRGRLAHFVSDDMSPKMVDNAAVSGLFTLTITQKDGTVVTRQTVKLNDPVKAIQELNKMERVYGEVGLIIDNRTLNVTVASPEGAEMVKRIAAGEGTGKEKLDA